jgi:hypothetical protein
MGNVILGSRESISTFRSFEESHADHDFLRSISKKLGLWLTTNLPLYGCSLPPNGKVEFNPDDSVKFTFTFVYPKLLTSLTDCNILKPQSILQISRRLATIHGLPPLLTVISF